MEISILRRLFKVSVSLMLLPPVTRGEERCVAPLRLPVYDIQADIASDQRRSFILYDVCTMEFVTEQEASNKGINLDLVYKTIRDSTGVDFGSTEQFSKLLTWKKSSCSRYTNDLATAAYRTSLSQMLNSLALAGVREMYNRCISQKGLGCTVTANASDILLHVDWVPPGGTAPGFIPKVERSTASNARQLSDPDSASSVGAIWPRGTKIVYGGVTRVLRRVSRTESVTFSVNTDAGSAPCDGLAAGGRYTVTVTMVGGRRVVRSGTKSVTGYSKPIGVISGGGLTGFCAEGTPVRTVTACSDGDPVSSAQWEIQSRWSYSCFQAVSMTAVPRIDGKCASFDLIFRECSRPPADRECSEAKVDGAIWKVNLATRYEAQEATVRHTVSAENLTAPYFIAEYPEHLIGGPVPDFSLTQVTVSVVNLNSGKATDLSMESPEKDGFSIVVSGRKATVLFPPQAIPFVPNK